MKMIPDFIMKEIEPLISTKKSTMGRPLSSAVKALNGVAYVLMEGCRWKSLPREFGAPSTVHGRFLGWVRSGIFDQIKKKAAELYMNSVAEPITWYAIDTSSCKAPLLKKGGRNPTDRGKRGVKKSTIVDQKGAPLGLCVGPANRHDSKFLTKTLDDLPISHPNITKIMAADSAYDGSEARATCRQRNFVLLAATNVRRNKNKMCYKPSLRWVVERTFGWFAWYRGLKTCWAKNIENFEAFLKLAASIQLFKMC